MPTTLDGLAGTGQLVFELLLPAEQIVAWHPRGVELQLRGVRRTTAELVQLAHHLRPGVPPGTMNRAWPRCPALPRAHCSTCSGEAAWPIVERADAGITIANPIPAQPENSSSMNIGSDRPVGSPIRSR